MKGYIFHATTQVTMAIVMAKNSASVWNKIKFIKLVETSNIETAKGITHDDIEKYPLFSMDIELSNIDMC